jgi:hypothetical protein
MKNFIKCLAIVGLISVGVACEKKSSNDSQAAAPSAELSQVPSAETLAAGDTVVSTQAAMGPSGNAVATSTVVSHDSAVGETPAGSEGMTWEEIIAAYPALADRVIFLSSIDKVVETDARTIDLYSAGSLVLTLQYNEAGDALVVRNSSHAGFAADLITFESRAAEQSQGNVVETLDFMMSSCDVAPAKEEPKQEQEQAQEPAKEEAVKEEPKQEQEQAKEEVVKEEPKQEQEQAQKEMPKEEPKEEPKKECASIVASLVLEQVVEKQEQKQEVTKEEPKQEQEQKQEAPVKQEQAQKQEVAKEEPKQEQAQKQEVAKEEPKQEQEQAQKETPKEEPKAPEQEQKQEPKAPTQAQK